MIQANANTDDARAKCAHVILGNGREGNDATYLEVMKA